MYTICCVRARLDPIEAGCKSMPPDSQHDFDKDEKDDDDFKELSPIGVGLVGDNLVNTFHDFQFSLDALLPFFEVEASGQQAINAGKILIADQLEDVPRAFEEAVGFDSQLSESAKRPSMTAPERQPAGGKPVNEAVGLGQTFIESVIDVSEFKQLKIGELYRLQCLIAIMVQQECGRPVGDVQVVRAITDRQPQSFGNLLLAERFRFQPHQSCKPARQIGQKIVWRRQRTGGMELEDEVLFAEIVLPNWIVDRREKLLVKRMENLPGQLHQPCRIRKAAGDFRERLGGNSERDMNCKAHRGKVENRRLGWGLHNPKLGKLQINCRKGNSEGERPIADGAGRSSAPGKIVNLRGHQGASPLHIDFFTPVKRHVNVERAADGSATGSQQIHSRFDRHRLGRRSCRHTIQCMDRSRRRRSSHCAEDAMRKTFWLLGITLLIISPRLGWADDKETESKELFNGKDLSGWKLRDPNAAERSKWRVVSTVTLKKGMNAQLAPTDGTGVLLNGGDGRGCDLLTEATHGDCELHIEFNVPRGSNSGVYFQGQYELQILDSHGKENKSLTYQDCGGIYNTAPPKINASKAPGEWQTFDVLFRAPRFDADGKKTANAKFVKVVHNGKIIHENVEVKQPTTASLGGPEKPVGPLLLQGDHGPVAFRNIKLKAE